MPNSRSFLAIALLTLTILLSATHASAVENPLEKPNNKFGIHILFDSELKQAAELVNANGGDWGYVIIPMQAGDRDLTKWQKFMDGARSLHVVPIIRLASEGDYFNTKVWRKPSIYDIIDFSNFLNSLHWPTKNRYVIVFNEVNRGDEWGGSPNPAEYAQLLSYAVSVFKSRSDDFFIISAGLDNAAPNKYGEYMNQYDFMRAMNQAVPGIFNQIDALSSHSYPNPSFAQPPSVLTSKSISSFKYEQELAESLSVKALPVFITETGWSEDFTPDQTIASYYQTALQSIWADSDIVAITPFLLHAGGGPFKQFSFFKEDGSEKEQYKTYKSFAKTKGAPTLTDAILSANIEQAPIVLPTRSFDYETGENREFSLSLAMQQTFRWIMKL